MAEATKRDWDKIVSESKNLYHLPDVLREESEEWMKLKNDQEETAKILGKKMAVTNLALENIVFKMRQHLEELDVKECWTVEAVGFQPEALKDGKFIIVTESR